MNNLNRTIQQGEAVVIQADKFAVENLAVEARVFVCESGFGMYGFTTGSKIAGYWLCDNQRDVVTGNWIDVKETGELQLNLYAKGA